MNGRRRSAQRPRRGGLVKRPLQSWRIAGLALMLATAPLAELEAQATAAPVQPPPRNPGVQSGAPGSEPTMAPEAGAQPPAPYGAPEARGGGNLQRQQLELLVRRRFEQIVRARLQLTDQQVAELRQTNQHYAAPRRALAERERGLRQAMRQELRDTSPRNQALLGAQIDSILVIQRTRLDLLASEQRELSRFLTPAQRVQYYALQEQLRQRVEQMRRQQQMRMQMGLQPGAPYAPGGGGGRGRQGVAPPGAGPGATPGYDTLRP
jgi:periplasmic protein CpxP/Spy